MSNLLAAAHDELETCRLLPPGEPQTIACEQAAEKTWGYIHRFTRDLLHVEEGRGSHQMIRDRLDDIDKATQHKMLLLDRYDLLAQLHGEFFYTGGCQVSTVEHSIEKARIFVEDLKRAVRL